MPSFATILRIAVSKGSRFHFRLGFTIECADLRPIKKSGTEHTTDWGKEAEYSARITTWHYFKPAAQFSISVSGGPDAATECACGQSCMAISNMWLPDNDAHRRWRGDDLLKSKPAWA